jgi:hypothetical protein
MTRTLIAVALAALLIPSLPAPVHAGPIENACVRSDRPNVSRSLCACIQAVANQTLNRSDQRQAARFFRDPQRAQDVRMSKSARDNEFWTRYRAFGEAAELRCSA